MMEPLASFGNSKSQPNTNLSRSISLSILDQYENEISIQTNENQSIEIIIPRDPNLHCSFNDFTKCDINEYNTS